MKPYFNTEGHDQLVSLSYGRYDDMRMAWVGRPDTPRVFAITDVSSLIASVSEDRVWMTIQNVDNANDVFLNFGIDAVADSCMRLRPGETLLLDRFTPWRNVIHAICGAGLTATLLVNDVTQTDILSGRGA